MLEYRSAGESHGKGFILIIDGMPAGVKIEPEKINAQLKRRQGGYGRGGRMKIEKDRVEIISGIRAGFTLGSPIGIYLENKDWKNWNEIMSVVGKINDSKKVTKPRPGHADLAGILKYNHNDIRNILERASARETAARVAAGSIFSQFLTNFNIDIVSHVLSIGNIELKSPEIDFEVLKKNVENSPLHCYDKEKEKEMMSYIDKIKEKGDSLGGILEVRTTELPVGLGSHVQWNRRLDGRLAQAIMSIPAIKGVEIGPAFDNAKLPGSLVHDEIYYSNNKGYYHKTNRAGGLEGGISNGEGLIIRMAMKPIPTLTKPLNSVDIKSKKSFKASIERSDVTAVPAAGVVGEAMVSLVLADALLEKFGGDSMEEIERNYNNFVSGLS